MIYPITNNSRLYEEAYSLVVSISSMFVACSYKLYGPIQFTPTDFVWLDGKATNKTIAFPLCGPVEDVISNIKPDCMEISVYDIDNKEPPNGNYVHLTSLLIGVFNNLFSVYFISYYEKNAGTAKRKFDNIYGTNKGKSKFDEWPSSWRMGWVVRNALVHNGKVFYSHDRMETPPVNWYNAHVSPQKNQGDPLIGNIVNFADLLILGFEMDTDLSD